MIMLISLGRRVRVGHRESGSRGDLVEDVESSRDGMWEGELEWEGAAYRSCVLCMA